MRWGDPSSSLQNHGGWVFLSGYILFSQDPLEKSLSQSDIRMKPRPLDVTCLALV